MNLPRESYITLMESAHHPDAIPIWLAEEAHNCYSVDHRVAQPLFLAPPVIHTSRYCVLERNGGMVEWRNGGMAEWWNDGMAEWQNGGMAEWRSGGMAEWHNVRYKIVRNQDTESTQMPPWQSPSRLVWN
jgi:hypothetical protein